MNIINLRNRKNANYVVFNHTRAVFDVVDPIGGGKIIAYTVIDALIRLVLFKFFSLHS